jgi:TatD DNase family protein
MKTEYDRWKEKRDWLRAWANRPGLTKEEYHHRLHWLGAHVGWVPQEVAKEIARRFSRSPPKKGGLFSLWYNPTMFIDTHGHLNFNAFKEDSAEVIQRTLALGMQVIMPGTQYTTSQKAVELAQQQDLYAAVGLHPIHLAEKRKVDVLEVQSQETTEQPWMLFETRAEEFHYQQYKELAQNKKTVAIGEVGLDYYYKPKGKARFEAFKEKQKEVLRQQINLALELNLPVIFHCRVAHNDLLSLLKEEYANNMPKGVIHSYTGDIEQTKQFLELGFFFGFNGLILKQVAGLNPQEIISFLPLERIVLETDSPYLIPPLAVAGTVPATRNEPLFVKYVAEEIARIKSISVQEVAKTTTQNAQSLFGLLEP